MRSLAFLIALAAALSAAAPAPLQRDLTVTGTVLDDGTGAALGAARVFVPGTGHQTTTAFDGTYSLALPAAWVGTRVEVRAERAGFQGYSGHVTLAAGGARLDFRLVPSEQLFDQVGGALVASEAEADMRRLSAVSPMPASISAPGRRREAFNTEAYAHVEENGFLGVDASPLSTFSIDVDRASYSNVRRFILDGALPPVDAVRIEEMINYFPYDYLIGDGDHPFTVTAEVAPAPWAPRHRLVRIGLQAERVETSDMPPANLVFLLDVSGSMDAPDKLPLLKTAVRMLVNQLRPQDRVAMVVYAGAAGLVLPSTPGSEKEVILDALESLSAGGSTAGGAGLTLAYDVARANHVEGGNNRVILATDGDFNVGPSSDGEMIRLIEARRDEGTFLSVLGFGTGNLKDSKMEQVADHGNGNYAYIDGVLEARKQLVSEMGGTLLTVARDVKIQVEFNPATVRSYRLIGYENRLLADEDFNDDTKDAGELGAGHSVTALYEVVPVGVAPVGTAAVDPLRYQAPRGAAPRLDSDELLFVKVRYKSPEGGASRLLRHPVVDRPGQASTDLRFAGAVAAFGMLLRGSEHCGDFTLDDVAELARSGRGADADGYRSEFVRLVETARELALARRGTL